jgi:hypothetical protein
MKRDDPVTSKAIVATDRARRYGKQLASHFSERARTSWDAQESTGSVIFSDGRGEADLVADKGALRITIHATAATVENLENVVGRHLAKFGIRDGLVISWSRSESSRGTERPA